MLDVGGKLFCRLKVWRCFFWFWDSYFCFV